MTYKKFKIQHERSGGEYYFVLYGKPPGFFKSYVKISSYRTEEFALSQMRKLALSPAVLSVDNYDAYGVLTNFDCGF